ISAMSLIHQTLLLMSGICLCSGLCCVNTSETPKSSKCGEQGVFDVEQSIQVDYRQGTFLTRMFYELKYFLITLCSWERISEFIIYQPPTNEKLFLRFQVPWISSNAII
uniref:Uncharacterized protein n=1 Tax=Calidris pygmaea TaxID=425635 RepID=A0A8C3PJS8_9CHAR